MQHCGNLDRIFAVKNQRKNIQAHRKERKELFKAVFEKGRKGKL